MLAVCSYFQQFLHCSIPGFMFAPSIVAIKFSTLNLLLIRLLAFALLWVSHMLIQTMDMSDLDETLINCGFEAKTTLLKMWLFLSIFSTSLVDSLVLVWLERYCCGNHLSQRQMITQTVNLLVRYQVGNSQENSTKSLFLIRVLYIQSPHGPCY